MQKIGSISIYFTDEDVTVNEPIEQDKPLSEIRPEPYSLPSGFVWDTLTLDNPQTVSSFSQFFTNFHIPMFFKPYFIASRALSAA